MFLKRIQFSEYPTYMCARWSSLNPGKRKILKLYIVKLSFRSFLGKEMHFS